METIEIDLDDETIDALERIFFDKYIRYLSEPSQSVWRDGDPRDLPKRLGEALLNEFIIEVIESAVRPTLSETLMKVRAIRLDEEIMK